jgi:phage N-6-adenine-methyltransferase
MSVVGYRARNHPQQVAKRGPNSAVDDRAVPAEVFAPLNERFRFTIDVAASAANTKCPRFYTMTDSGLTKSWAGERVWCNPPYSHPNLGRWLDKAWQQATTAEVIVMLVPANRTEQTWWQKHVEPFRDRPGSLLRTEFLPGRLRFLSPGRSVIGPNERPPFGCCLLIWNDRP